MSVLASRDRLCVNKKVCNAANVTEACKKAVSAKACQYFHNVPLLKTARAFRRVCVVRRISTKDPVHITDWHAGGREDGMGYRRPALSE